MINRPQLFLNGTAPLNVTGAAHSCVFELNESTSDPGVCTDAVGTDQDSFLWYVVRPVAMTAADSREQVRRVASIRAGRASRGEADLRRNTQENGEVHHLVFVRRKLPLRGTDYIGHKRFAPPSTRTCVALIH